MLQRFRATICFDILHKILSTKNIKHFILRNFRSLGKTSFYLSLKKDASILDIGCGNNSPLRIKKMLPHCNYVGIDICNYNQKKNPNIYADDYIISEPKKFAYTILNIEKKFDAVISSHNLEHCDDRDAVLHAMCQKVAKGGFLYLSFPSQESVNFPSRKNTLNYYDDETHKGVPPNFTKILKIMKDYKIYPLRKEKNYQPIIFRILGIVLEPYARFTNKVLPGTWEKYGFESIIIGIKH